MIIGPHRTHFSLGQTKSCSCCGNGSACSMGSAEEVVSISISRLTMSPSVGKLLLLLLLLLFLEAGAGGVLVDAAMVRINEESFLLLLQSLNAGGGGDFMPRINTVLRWAHGK